MTQNDTSDPPPSGTQSTDGLNLLSGVRVVDFTQALSGPYCTLMLADLGADVIKVESPFRGDDARHWGPPFVGEDAAYFMSVNRNKRSVALDLKKPDDLRRALKLVESADVVVENWRPGTADRLGLGAETLRKQSPNIIYCSISGFGQDQGTRSGYDQIVQGTSGVMTLTGPSDEPTKWGVPVADIAAGMYAATAVLAALHHRNASRTGRTIDIAMQDTLISMLTHHAGRYLANGEVPDTSHNGHATIAPYGLFRTSDGFINLCVGNDSQFQRMCEALGRPELVTDPRFTTNPLRLENKPALLDEVDRGLKGLTTVAALQAMDEVGVPAGAVLRVDEVLNDPATHAREMIVSFSRDDVTDARTVNTPWKFDGAAPTVRMPPPLLGQHTDDVLGSVDPHPPHDRD
jgi:crotonobetainyl-CoA:carnitine CoA-transferase CaiB-like acyl-CoA transferase